jgi:hypothetical protein
MNIPSVKTWIVKLFNGSKFEVLAPTKRLALLNFKFENLGVWVDSRATSLNLRKNLIQSVYLKKV